MALKTVTFTQPTRVGTLYNTGETAGFDAAMAEGLVAQGFAVWGAAAIDVPEPPQRAGSEAPVTAAPAEITPATAGLQTTLAQVPAAVTIDPRDDVVIPEGWASLGTAELRALAAQLGAPGANKADAVIAIEGELARRAA